MSRPGINIKEPKTRIDDYYFPTKINSELPDVNRLKKKVEELQQALCVAIDENDNVNIS